MSIPPVQEKAPGADPRDVTLLDQLSWIAQFYPAQEVRGFVALSVAHWLFASLENLLVFLNQRQHLSRPHLKRALRRTLDHDYKKVLIRWPAITQLLIVVRDFGPQRRVFEQFTTRISVHWCDVTRVSIGGLLPVAWMVWVWAMYTCRMLAPAWVATRRTAKKWARRGGRKIRAHWPPVSGRPSSVAEGGTAWDWWGSWRAWASGPPSCPWAPPLPGPWAPPCPSAASSVSPSVGGCRTRLSPPPCPTSRTRPG